MKTLNHGFTLLEIMIAVAIIGVLAAIAIPSYQDYSSKTQINVVYRELSTLKIPADLMLIDNTSTEVAEDLGWVSGSSPLMSQDPNVSVVSSTGLVTIEAILDGRVNAVALGVKVTLMRDETGKWACTVKRSTNLGWKDEFAPKACQVAD